ncbi:acid phosphatase-like protein [Arabidopsis thaliana]|jgi:acid phosphatase|uniref:Acid phosphatase-like protein n=1 Tax=Arabidopsis thaliana TaxID=3702 RepID=Q9M0F5_ARATH|nr:HAD superfamily, subfamily IIIB acid phosphatase [Arabidopsis thaliana]AAK93622.1 putative acid phosphatase [Arabidopsis thaliana]AAM14114.1 putative acid phosphatase [Arabidopsis thaliana]AEE85608.1 HAD superfamily, subfamily IIIB acid phosphatase [Arabidopsis thaliana]CAB79684.1 acid phosphatase-like protein [Arabidopsis thaliana]|eukprot:NP_194655.1 HAD superfamily, subfamily IIIB acid phosphatase [Arabidopsis thaliana]
MASLRSLSIWFFFFFVFVFLINPSISIRTSFIKLPGSDGSRYCDSWRLAAETNNVGTWDLIPSICVDSVAEYLNGDQFLSDYSVIVDYALAFAKSVEISGDGKDVWIFDIDETLLTNIDYYKAHGYGSEPYDDNKFSEWVEQGTAPAFDASLRLYNALKKLGFTIILLTGRDEHQRTSTETNLRDAGYSGWERLLLRGPNDQGKSATNYKSEQRSKLIEEGFKIRGNSGDQWSDLQGFAVADRSFKVPNPMYYIP